MILSQFTCDEPVQKASGLAERLSLHPSTVYRYLEALEDAHLLERDERSGNYKLGIKVVELSAVFLRDLPVRRHALDEMDGLRDSLGLLVNLGVLRDAEVVHVAHAFPSGYPRENMHIGRTAVAQTTALGKVLLATLPPEEALARVTKAGWRPYTQNSISDATRLKVELENVRLRGFAVDHEERHIGIMCVGVPIPYSSNDISGALSVSGRSERIAGRVEELAAELTAAAKRVSARIGGPSSIVEYL